MYTRNKQLNIIIYEYNYNMNKLAYNMDTYTNNGLHRTSHHSCFHIALYSFYYDYYEDYTWRKSEVHYSKKMKRN